MAWFLNHYDCYRCGERWTDEWSCVCDDECPCCGARHNCAVSSDDLTEIVVQRGGALMLLRSPDSAEHSPKYEEIAELEGPVLPEQAYW